MTEHLAREQLLRTPAAAYRGAPLPSFPSADEAAASSASSSPLLLLLHPPAELLLGCSLHSSSAAASSDESDGEDDVACAAAAALEAAVKQEQATFTRATTPRGSLVRGWLSAPFHARLPPVSE
jgi:hypothetical protein